MRAFFGLSPVLEPFLELAVASPIWLGAIRGRGLRELRAQLGVDAEDLARLDRQPSNSRG